MKGIYLFIFLIIAISLNSQAIYENSVVYPVYDGDDLGVIWKGNEVNINVWAPTASDVSFQLYKDGHGGNPLKVI